MAKLKLYVWEDMFCDWTCGIAVALAHSKEEALKLIKQKYGDYEYRECQKCEPRIIEAPEAFVTKGGS